MSSPDASDSRKVQRASSPSDPGSAVSLQRKVFDSSEKQFLIDTLTKRIPDMQLDELKQIYWTYVLKREGSHADDIIDRLQNMTFRSASPVEREMMRKGWNMAREVETQRKKDRTQQKKDLLIAAIQAVQPTDEDLHVLSMADLTERYELTTKLPTYNRVRNDLRDKIRRLLETKLPPATVEYYMEIDVEPLDMYGLLEQLRDIEG